MNDIKTVDEQRTIQQNKALHLWFRQKAKQCQDAGVTAQMALSKTIELEMSPEMMKEIFREVMKAKEKKISTTQLNKHIEIEDLIEHLNRYFAEKWNLEGIALPSLDEALNARTNY